MRQVACLVVVGMVLTGCSRGPYSIEGLTCDTEHASSIEYWVNPDGAEFARDALAGFVFGPTFQERDDWVALRRSDSESSEVTHIYVDDRGHAQLIVELAELPGGWYVSAIRYCD